MGSRKKALQGYRRKGGHPRKVAELRARMDPQNPDAQELRRREFEARELGRLARDQALANEDESPLAGVAVPAARFLAPAMCEVFGLEGEEHLAAVENFLVERILPAVRDAVVSATAVDYRDWRVESIRRVSRQNAA